MTEEEIRAQREQCADCGGALQEVKVLDRADYNAPLPMLYYPTEPQKNVWMGKHYVAEGEILTFICSRCARISFYGAAHDDKGDGPKNAADTDR